MEDGTIKPQDPVTNVRSSVEIDRAVPALGALVVDLDDAMRSAFLVEVPSKARQRQLSCLRDEARLCGDLDEERLACWELAWTSSRLALAIARKFVRPHLEVGDLAMAALLGLFRAAEKWDPLGGAFSTYGMHWASQAVKRHIADHSRLVRVPVHAHEDWLKANRFARLFESTYGYPPALDQKVTATACSQAVLAAAERASEPYLAWEEIISQGDRGAFYDFGPRIEWSSMTLRETDLSEFAARLEIKLQLGRALRDLEPRERGILIRRFGFDGIPETLEQVGTHFGLTRERIRQIEKEALKKVASSLHILFGYPIVAKDASTKTVPKKRMKAISDVKLPASDERTRTILSLLQARSAAPRREERSPLIEISWLGKVPTCFLLPEGWALRMYVTERQLRDLPWTPPLEYGLAIGLKPGEARSLIDPELPGKTISIARRGDHIEAESLSASLKARKAKPGDLAFIVVRPSTLSIVLRRREELVPGDRLGELLWRCGIEKSNDLGQRSPWEMLTRTLGGSGATKMDVSARLGARGQDDLLELLEQVRPAEYSGLPEGWHYRLPLASTHESFALVSGSLVKVAFELGGKDGGGKPVGGLSWIDVGTDDLTNLRVRLPPELQARSLRSGVVRWCRAEHAARRTSLIGIEWTINVLEGSFDVKFSSYADVISALEDVAVVLTSDSTVPPVPGPSECNVPASAFAVQRAADRLRRSGVTSISSDSLCGFRLSFLSGKSLEGFCLFDLMLRAGESQNGAP